MKLELQNNKDFLAGLMFLGIGVGAMSIARHYPFGSTLRMGPGYLPMVLSVILMLFGLVIMIRGLRSRVKIRGNWSIRAVFLLPLSIVLYAVLMDFAGFVPALIALTFISAVSGKEFKFKEVLLLAIALCLVSIGIFIWALNLPYPLIIGF